MKKTSFNCTLTENPDEAYFEFIMYGLLLNIIGVLGIFGNIISMIILSRPQMKSSINYLLIGLAKCDTMLILTSILLMGVPGIYPYTRCLFKYYYYVYPHMVPILYPIATIAQTGSVYLTMTVTLERYVAVCHPLRARSLCTYGRARIYVLVIAVFSILYNLPRFWEMTHLSTEIKSLNTTIYCVKATDLRDNDTYIAVYIHWMYFVFLYFVPFVSLAVLNMAIYRQIRKANVERQRLSRLQKREIGLATMLLIVVSVFFVCNIFALISNILEYTDDIVDWVVKLSNLLVTINSSVNFIIYVTFGDKFKRLFLKLFCNNRLYLGTGTGRESPDGATPDDSFMSCGDRHSIRLRRTNANRNDGSVRSNKPARNNTNECRSNVKTPTANPGPCIYYPANYNSPNKDISVTPPTQTTTMDTCDWDHDNGIHNTGF